MRQIKFRAWDMVEKEIVPHVGGEYNPLYILSQTGGEDDNQFKFMQFTGLTDKNGKEIYEGDILKRLGVVEYREGSGGGADHGAVWIGYQQDEMCSFAEDEIIGNIYENPELI